MNRKTIAIVTLMLAIIVGGYWLMGSKSTSEGAAKPGEQAEGDKKTEGGDIAEISDEAAELSGIAVDAAGPATVKETITLSGRITLNQNTTAQVKARFAGIVREVKKGQGESVTTGDVLAMVESNDSLQVYPVKSPINGVILARNTNVGDVAGDTPLFTVANVSDVWAEFHVFPRDIDRIKNGQDVNVTSFEGHHTGEAPITVVLPVAEASSQTVIARVVLSNSEGLWHSGMTVRGEVAVNQMQAALAVKTSAIQRMEGKTVVFVKDGTRYSIRPVKTGLSDSQFTEIVQGLQEGETYVSQNSFLIKADIGKAGAEHED